MIERAGIKLVDVTGIEPVTPCLQSRAGKTLTVLSGVAYTENRRNSRSSIVPKLYRTVPSLKVPIRMPEFCCEFHQSSPCGGQERVHRQYLVQSWREP